MINMENTFYDQSSDGVIPIVPGIYPAHVSSFEGREIGTKLGTQKVFNIEFQIADAVDKMEIQKHEYVDDALVGVEVDGKPQKISASFMKGKRFKSVGIWLTENPADGEGWRNRNYVNFFQSLGVQFPTTDDGKVKLAEVEEQDVIGLPAFVKLDKEFYEKDGEQRSSWKAFSATSWADGERLSADEVSGEDVPF
tara:strand:- start:295 stop:879 length:585 start_codon:yes stop_codon:yes gene_type:complete